MLLSKTTSLLHWSKRCSISGHPKTFFTSSVQKISKGRRSFLPNSIGNASQDSTGFKDLLKPLGFTIAICGVSFVGASIAQYEVLRARARRHLSYKYELNVKFYGKAGSFRQQVNNFWNSLLPGEKMVYGIIAVNTFVFLLWRIPRLQPFMTNYFVSSPTSSAPCWSMLLSAFSHHSAIHLFANMYVLLSFSTAITNALGNEQFLGTYVSAAVISAFVSHAVKVLKKNPVPSLGASGAIMATLGMVCTMQPNAKLSVAFIDQIYPHNFSADSAIKGLILFDLAGLLLGWRLFDHAAHLGGVFFGIWYAKQGHELIWHRREGLVKMWHRFRGPPQP